jgi:hypothetical protein
VETGPGQETAPPREEPTERASRVTRGSTFAFLWAVANIIHIVIHSGGRVTEITPALNLMAAVFVLGRPSSRYRLALLATTHLLDTGWVLPYAPDHQLLAAVVNVLILGSFAVDAARKTVGNHGMDGLVDRVAPAARVLLLVGYAAAAIAKYNIDYVDPVTSCGAFLAETASYGLIDRDHGLSLVPLWGTLVIESLVPVFLLIPRTRRWGVLFGGAFHYIVSLSPAVGVADFTFLLFALFFLFLPKEQGAAVGRRVVSRWRSLEIVSDYDRVPRWVFGAVLTVLLGATGIPAVMLLWLFTTTAGLWWLIETAGVLRGSPPEVEPIGRPSVGQLLVILLLLLIAFRPYAGFGTSSAFTMFSGVRTEGPGTTHYFMPSFHLIDSQNDYLIVLELSDEDSPVAEARAAVPVTEIRRSMADRANGGVFQTADGERMVVVAGEDHPLREPPPWWEAKTQHYRPFKVEGVTDTDFCSN